MPPARALATSTRRACASPAPPTRSASPVGAGPSGLRIAAWSTAGAGGAALVTGLVLTLLSQTRFDDATTHSDGVATLRLESPSLHVAVAAARPRRALLLVGAFALLLAGVALAPERAPVPQPMLAAPAPEPARAPAPAPPPVPSPCSVVASRDAEAPDRLTRRSPEVAIVVTSVPKGAAVFDGRLTLGRTPLRVYVGAARSPTLTVKARGFQPATIALDPAVPAPPPVRLARAGRALDVEVERFERP